eukprot:9527713-Lingulodinium_polyedra.AAC.1
MNRTEWYFTTRSMSQRLTRDGHDEVQVDETIAATMGSKKGPRALFCSHLSLEPRSDHARSATL